MRRLRFLQRIGLVTLALLVLAACRAAQPTITTSTPVPIVASPAPTKALVPLPEGSPFTPTSTLQPTTPTSPPPPPTATAAAPQVLSFTASPVDGVAVGDTVSASWEATGERADLCFIGAAPAYCREVPLAGTTTLTVEEGMLACRQLGLRASVGGDFTWSFIDLHYRCPEEWFFAGAPDACPQAPTTSHAAGQYFEHGFMVWTETPDQFYAFFDDGQYVMIAAPYTFVAPDVVEAVPPAGLLEPVSGFGKLWRGELAGVDAAEVRRRLGWATAPEFAFDTAYQCELQAQPHLWLCYLRAPDGDVLRLHPDSSAQVRLLWERL